MGIFSRFKDIVSANLNSMLDKAEDPEKMIRLMIREMEETLVELKAGCARIMAQRKRVGREADEIRSRAELWDKRARMAVDKGRDDLAREALYEKRRYDQRVGDLDEEASGLESLTGQAKEDIVRLEEKLESAKERQRLLVARHKRAAHKKKARTETRAADSSETWMRFERFEQRIEAMEAEADLVDHGRPSNLDEAFSQLEHDEDIERELADLKKEKTDA